MSAAEQVERGLAEHAEVLAVVRTELAPAIVALAERVREALAAGGTIFFCGNGGSAADAQHLAAEYVVRFARDRRALPALALTTDSSVLTAAANDHGFESVFERQVRALARPGDVLVLHSTSGASENLIRAALAARERGVATVALLARDGGPLAGHVDQALVVPTESTARAQEMHLLIGHLVCEHVERAAGTA